MKIGIFGANGMLGRYLVKYLSQHFNVTAFTRKDLDIELATIDSVEMLVKDFDYIINSAGVIPQRGDSQIKRYIKVNTLFPQWLSLLANKCDYKFIHITTDCVYTGKRSNYTEDDPGDEMGVYGMTKYLGENDRACIIRTSIIGEELENKRSLLEWVRSNAGGEINGYLNHYWNGITCLQLAKIVDNIISQGGCWQGVRHVYSNVVSKYQLLKIINKIYNLNIKINEHVCDTPVDKTLMTIYTPITVPDLRDQIKEMKEFNI